MRQTYIFIFICAILGIVAACHFHDGNTSQPPSFTQTEENEQYGFDANNHHYSSLTVEPDQFLSEILTEQGFPFRTITSLESKAKDIYDIRRIRAGKNLTFVHLDSCSSPCCMIYEPNPFEYVRYHLEDSLCVEIVEKEVNSELEIFEGSVETSLWDALIGEGHSPGIIDKLEDAFASSVDFYHVQKGDSFKFLYEKLYVEGDFVGYGNVHGAYFINAQGKHYAIYYENDKYEGFYDTEGRPTKSGFLRSPVRYSRISSRFNRRRFHPIKKRVIPHLGTDYAAPKGTPIRSVADGVIEKVSYTRNNGKYVKVRHGKTYKTQYLHMSGFAKGMKSGVPVKQGQTIGYVGQTGLATGPHVCFRFWKNGKQTNHLRENFPPADPMAESELPLFFHKRDEVKNILDSDAPIESFLENRQIL